MRPVLATIALACALIGAGCGAGAGEGQTSLVVTRDFGTSIVKSSADVELTAGLTATRQLQKLHPATTSYGGRYVDSIGGLKESGAESWLYYVNGVEADRGATSVRLAAGDRVQWDFHRWQATRTGGAIIGAYPEPLRSRGAELVCRPKVSAACSAAGAALKSAGVLAGKARASQGEAGAVRVIVGPWKAIAGTQGVPDLTEPASTNGAFAEFSASGAKLTPVVDDGSLQAPEAAGTGLLAASSRGGSLVWLITGTDDAGVLAAAGLLDRPKQLANRFAMIASASGARALPESGAR